jgi:hypothetical protein
LTNGPDSPGADTSLPSGSDAGCGNGGSTVGSQASAHNPAFVGTWRYTSDNAGTAAYRVTFNADGTCYFWTVDSPGEKWDGTWTTSGPLSPS